MTENHPDQQVVVGYDDSRESEFALEWAARVAQRRHCPLLVVSATGVEDTSVELARPGIQEMYVRQAQRIAEAGAAKAQPFADIPVKPMGRPGGAANALINCANAATLLVIGHRARGLLPDAILGSVAFKLTSHAPCPVAVVRKSPRPLPSMQHPIVVGVDGSQYGIRALQEAARLAADTESFLRIVVAWKRPNWNLWSLAPSLKPVADKAAEARLAAAASSDAYPYEQAVADTAQQASDIAQQAASYVREHHPGLKTEQVISEEPADQAILASASDASLIAVGARGLGDLQGLQIGSISRKVMQRAECAVYVVR
ncbi:universal stress protein [Castellaniella caeni]|uniref:universal stress protein n=1 Tax=Castellaniella caeni TaxID=266123 RepID=UPI000836DFFA|nr:universal stress protein [Castellaniella caeni]